MTCAPRKFRLRRKLSLVPAVMVLLVTVLAWPLPRLLFAQSAAEPSVLPPAPIQAETKEASGRTGITINIDYTESPAAAAERLGDPRTALRERKAVLATGPSDVNEARYQVARAMLAAGDPTGARREILTVLENAPGFEKAQALLLELANRRPQ